MAFLFGRTKKLNPLELPQRFKDLNTGIAAEDKKVQFQIRVAPPALTSLFSRSKRAAGYYRYFANISPVAQVRTDKAIFPQNLSNALHLT
jgi:hypothetical protein